jgi:hypothetical protein
MFSPDDVASSMILVRFARVGRAGSFRLLCGTLRVLSGSSSDSDSMTRVILRLPLRGLFSASLSSLSLDTCCRRPRPAVARVGLLLALPLPAAARLTIGTLRRTVVSLPSSFCSRGLSLTCRHSSSLLSNSCTTAC